MVKRKGNAGEANPFFDVVILQARVLGHADERRQVDIVVVNVVQFLFDARAESVGGVPGANSQHGDEVAVLAQKFDHDDRPGRIWEQAEHDGARA